MAKAAQKAGRYRMTFPQNIIGEPVMHKLSTDYGLVPNIMRGRITDKSAYLDVELLGAAKSVEKALKYLADRGVTIQKLD